MSSQHLIPLLLLMFATVARLATPCLADEVPYFDCKFQRNAATLCASNEKDTGKQLLQYRMAKRDRIEMQYPNTPKIPDGLFMQSRILLIHGGEVRVSFNVGEYKYILYEGWDTRSPSNAGIYVLRQGKLLQQYQCDEYSERTGLLESLRKGSLQEEQFLELH